MRVDKRLSELTQIQGVIDKSTQNMFLDDGTNAHRATLNQILGSGAGAANSLTFREEITEVTDDMIDSISDGSFDLVHVGMHYTAPSGRNYWFGHADYNYGMGGTQQDRHTMLVIEDDITITSAHHSTNTTEGGAVASDIYTTVLPAHQGELEADFGAEHIIPQDIYLTNAVTNGVASGGAWASLYSSILTEKQIFGNDIRYTDGPNYFLNFLARERQLALFANMPETIVAHEAGTTNRKTYWTDTVESASDFGDANSGGNANYYYASNVFGVRRAFFIG